MNEMLYDAIGDVREDWILDAEQAMGKKPRRLWIRLLAACLALALLALPVHAEYDNGYVSNLLAPLFGYAQTELVDSIGVPVNASVEVGAYLLTAEAVIGDRYNVAIVYALTRQDGGVVPEGLQFSDWQMYHPFGSGGGSRSHQRSEDGKNIHIIQEYTGQQGLSWTNRLLFNRNVTVTFGNLVQQRGSEQEDTLILAGEWTLSFTLRYRDTTQRIHFRPMEVTDPEGNSYILKKGYVSPIGIHLDLTAPNLWADYTALDLGKVASEKGSALAQAFGESVILVLKDGTQIPMENWNFGGSPTGNADTMNIDYGSMFSVPIPLDNMEALIVCGVTIPLELE